ncbi:dihydroorotase [Kordiimonas pumila]|uniref:Dihydroorotase n=1 Tax=Kordiimonas pumila TaxID=2161677 RepID=A0ABV7D8X8_9PROT|nr:dihydroorotase [Kordiimonas pumila]
MKSASSDISTGKNDSNPARLVIRQPDDWHVHLRDGDMMAAVASYTARQFGRAIVMPNLTPPITTVAAAEAYRERIKAAVSADLGFTPLMTCYLTDTIDPAEVERGFKAGVFTASKLYPAHATTNSSHGVTDIKTIYPVLEVMQKIGMPFLVHGEVTDSDVDIFDREAVFIERTMQQVVADFPSLKIVFEHITTAEAADFVLESGANVGATVTPQHLEYNRNAMLVGGIRPHFYCLPIIKREKHRQALRAAVTSGSAKFFLGTDSAPHVVSAKETSCGCAGIFNAPYAIESYAKVFEEEGALGKLEAFASENGPKFYGLPENSRRIVLERKQVTVPNVLEAAGAKLVPFHAGNSLDWHFVGFDSE